MILKEKVIISIITSLFIPSLVFGSEFRFGQGTTNIKSKVFGYSSNLKENITTFSLSEIHNNIFKTNIFYGYDITFISSKKEKKYLDLYNSSLENPIVPSDYKPLMKYELQGLDAQLDLGYDIFSSHKKKSYIGIAFSLGITVPYIKNTNSNSNSDNTKAFLPDSKTKIKTYRIGITSKIAYNILKRISFFSFFTYAYQTGKVENKAIGIDSNVDGHYITAGIGVKFYIFETEKKIWKITLSPRIYLTAGYKYDFWLLKDIEIKNSSILVNKDDLEITNNTGFIGIGYAF